MNEGVIGTNLHCIVEGGNRPIAILRACRLTRQKYFNLIVLLITEETLEMSGHLDPWKYDGCWFQGTQSTQRQPTQVSGGCLASYGLLLPRF